MLIIALTVALATSGGVLCDRHTTWGKRLARGLMSVMLYGLMPFVSFVSFAHLKISWGGGVGILAAYVGLGLAATVAWTLGRRSDLARPALGGMTVAVMLVNTTYLGYPMTVALLGHAALERAVVYDQLVSGPVLFTAGFAVGSAFGDGASVSPRERVLVFFTRNPPLLGAVTGLLVPAAWAPPAFIDARNVIVDGMLVVGFTAVGIFLSSERREDQELPAARPGSSMAIVLLARFAINPALLGALSFAGVGIPAAYLLQSLMPCGITSLLVGHTYGLDQSMIATAIVWTTTAALLVGTVIYLA